MDNKKRIFRNSEGIGGFEQGLYDEEAPQPTASNCTRQSCFKIPDKPALIWKTGRKNAFLGGTRIGGSFAITGKKSIIVSECSNDLFAKDGKLLEISDNGIINEIFSCNKLLGIPVIGAGGIIYIYTLGASDSRGHQLFCLSPEGNIIWQYHIDYSIERRPILDKDGNIYMFTYGDVQGKLICLSKDGILNWEHPFKSINWCDPVITKNEVIYVGLNVSCSLCAFHKDGEMLWEKSSGGAHGSEFINMKEDGTMYVCYGAALHAISPNSELKWTYKPERTSIHVSPALGKDGRLCLNRTPNLLACLDADGNELWNVEIKGTKLQAPIIGNDGRIMQVCYESNYPKDKSWIQIFTPEGKIQWEYATEGLIVSAYLADDNLIYFITNIVDRKKSKNCLYTDWEVQAIGEI
jgi:outer membrane protein assembly factor BamB